MRVMVTGSGTWLQIKALNLNLLYSLERKSSHCLVVKPGLERCTSSWLGTGREWNRYIGKQSQAERSSSDDIISVPKFSYT